MAHEYLNPTAKRLIIMIEGGCLAGVFADGFQMPDDVQCISIDTDTDGADDDETHPFGSERAFVNPTDIVPADDDLSRNVRQAYTDWRLK